jgi:adenine phosphoribosyltransferase
MDDLKLRVFRTIKPVNFRGISEFFDISGLLKDPHLFSYVISEFCEYIKTLEPTVISALDARGFLFGAPVALKLGLSLVMIRKQGKLPGPCSSICFNKEYEAGDVFEIQSGAIRSSDRVVIIDDIFATGGSMGAAYALVRTFGVSEITGVCVMDLKLPGSRDIIKSNSMNIWSLLDVALWKKQA